MQRRDRFLAAIAIVAVAFVAMRLTSNTSADTSSDPTPNDATALATRESGEGPEASLLEMPVRAASDETSIRVLVQDPAGTPLAGAVASVVGDSAQPLTTSGGDGSLRIPWRVVEGRMLDFRRRDYCDARTETIEQPTQLTVTMYPRQSLSITAIERGSRTPIHAAVIRLTPRADTRAAGGRPHSSETGPSGVAVVTGIVSGAYDVTVAKDELVLVGLAHVAGADSPVLTVPSPPVTLEIDSPSVAWFRPETGRIVTGYFMRPLGKFSFSPVNRDILASIEAKLEDQSPGSRATSFLAESTSVKFVGFLSCGGWIEQSIPVTKWLNRAASPYLLRNGDQTEAGMGTVRVRAVDSFGRALPDPPYRLQFLHSGTGERPLGSFTFELSVSMQLPVGDYRLVPLQSGIDVLFERPTDGITVRSDDAAPTEFEIRARVPVCHVQAEFAAGSTDTRIRGTIHIDDDSGFESSLDAVDERGKSLWLPAGHPLRIRATERDPDGNVVHLETVRTLSATDRRVTFELTPK